MYWIFVGRTFQNIQQRIRAPCLLILLLLLMTITLISGVVASDASKSSGTTKAYKSLVKNSPPTKTDYRIIDLSEKQFQLYTRAPRNHTIVVLFTALGAEFQCHGCHEFEPQYKLLQRSIAADDGLRRSVFLGKIDFSVNRNIFTKLGLTTAPVIHVYRPSNTNSDGAPLVYEFQKYGAGIEPLLDFLNQNANIDVAISRPVDYPRIAQLALTGLAVVAGLYVLYAKFSFLGGIWQLWMLLTIVYCTVMTSGYMWNKIRSPPYMGASRPGQIEIFAGGFQNQYEVETQIVAAIYLTCGTALAGLASTGKRLNESPAMMFACAICLVTMLFGQGIVIQLFKIKNQGYPFTGILF